jgi:hypothetical protein
MKELFKTTPCENFFLNLFLINNYRVEDSSLGAVHLQREKKAYL